MRTARLAAGRPGACRKSLFDTLSNETRFTGLSFEKAAARGSARRARLRRTLRTFASRAVFSPTYTPPEKMIPISLRLRAQTLRGFPSLCNLRLSMFFDSLADSPPCGGPSGFILFCGACPSWTRPQDGIPACAPRTHGQRQSPGGRSAPSGTAALPRAPPPGPARASPGR